MTNPQIRKSLIVDDDHSCLELVSATLDDCQMPFHIAGSDEEAKRLLQDEGPYSLVVLRANGAQISGLDMCRHIRSQTDLRNVTILIILKDNEARQASDFLIAGASDLLVGFFEPRELRMRAGIVPEEQINRFDAAHTYAAQGIEIAEPQLLVPHFDVHTRRFSFGQNEHLAEQWEHDPEVRKIPLDRITVCPECSAVPTFRAGCGSCGSAWTEHEALLHHYACAHVGPEKDFLRAEGVVCPKCRLTDLVAGTDFEQLEGCIRCTDCDAIFSETKMIGHCLACEHRFPASEGVEIVIYGYQKGRTANSAVIAAPNYHSVIAAQAVPFTNR